MINTAAGLPLRKFWRGMLSILVRCVKCGARPGLPTVNGRPTSLPNRSTEYQPIAASRTGAPWVFGILSA